MTRAELEKEIVKKLWEIQEIVEAFDSSVEITNLTCSRDYINAFSLRKDENGEPNGHDPYFDISEFKEG